MPKAFVPLAGRPLLVHAVERVVASGPVGELVAVVPGDRVGEVRALAAALLISTGPAPAGPVPA